MDGLHVVVAGSVLHGLAADVAEEISPFIDVFALLLSAFSRGTNLCKSVIITVNVYCGNQLKNQNFTRVLEDLQQICESMLHDIPGNCSPGSSL